MTDVQESLRELLARIDDPISMDELRERRTRTEPPQHSSRRPLVWSAAACVMLLAGGLLWFSIAGQPAEVGLGTQGDDVGPTATPSPSVTDDPAVPAYTGTFGGFCPFLSQESIDRSFVHVPEGTPPRFDLLDTTRMCLMGISTFTSVAEDFSSTTSVASDFDLTVMHQGEQEATVDFTGLSGEAGRVELLRGADANAPWVVTAITSEDLQVPTVVADLNSDGRTHQLRLVITSSLTGAAELRIERIVAGVFADPVARSQVDLREGANEIVVDLDPTVTGEDLIVYLEGTDAAGATVLTKFRWAG